ncbi:MAG: DinB family protein [Ilumatobacteraceae bacterium]
MYPEIAPDDKDWTWVLERPCPECGFDASELDASSVAGLIRDNALEWQEVLRSPAEELRARPRVDRWTDLEYAAHVRDVHRRFIDRLVLMLEVDDPLFENWDQDETAREERYNEQDPIAVSLELADAAEHLAAGFDRVVGDQWQRTGRRSDGSEFTIATLALYLVHDPVHHLWDVRSAE